MNFYVLKIKSIQNSPKFLLGMKTFHIQILHAVGRKIIVNNRDDRKILKSLQLCDWGWRRIIF